MAHAPAGGVPECVPASPPARRVVFPSSRRSRPFCSHTHRLVHVNLELLRDDTRCPICLGVCHQRHVSPSALGGAARSSLTPSEYAYPPDTFLVPPLPALPLLCQAC